MKNTMKYVKWGLFLMIAVSICFIVDFKAINAQEEINVLYINSYHEGYKWSDDIKSAVESELSASSIIFNLQIEFLDTQQMDNNQLGIYFEQLVEVYRFKYTSRKIDAIITSDDAAFQFITEYCGEIFGQTPIFFCGLNNYDEEYIKKLNVSATGVTEAIDVNGTLSMIKEIHPSTKRIHYIIDDTITGNKINAAIDMQISNMDLDLEVIRAEGKTINEIENYVANLSEGDIVLFTIYYYDANGRHFSYDEGVKRISAMAPVPIYGLWNFHLGHGIIGGNLLDGYSQGSIAAHMVIDYVNGVPIKDIPTLKNKPNSTQFDYLQLKRFSIPLAALPENCDIINYSMEKKKNVLILHSYDPCFEWTQSINQGILNILNESIDGCTNILINYMYLKHVSNSVYLKEYSEVLKEKYANQPIDLIIVSDDGALDFIIHYFKNEWVDIPIIFCGINHYDQTLSEKHPNMTGIIETIDIKGTIELMLNVHQNLKKIVIINDTTLTGAGNKKNLEEIIPSFEGQLEFEFVEDVNMSYVQQYVSELESDTAILLMSFNRDKSNNQYTYDECAYMISEYANVPIYSVWDFYLGKGVIGGKMIQGYEQGEKAGILATRVLAGEAAHTIPVESEGLHQYMFDNEVLMKYNIKSNKLPKDSKVINQHYLINLYQNNQQLFNQIIFFFAIALLLIVLLIVLLRVTLISRTKIKIMATVDSLTGLYNRGTGIDMLNKRLQEDEQNNTTTVIAFADINNLKSVNDQFGHQEGDFLIKESVRVMKECFEPIHNCCRMGGDEFLVIFNEISLKEAKKITRKFIEGIQLLNEKHNKAYIFSISIGFAESKSPSRLDTNALIELADKDMYRDKKRIKEKEFRN